ncbi:MAG TPA: c-type cytochrome [Casimicrobiaceae bacterium]|nr:c-type cytochrome [Casimicrobiaceae bacterium]
MSVEVPGSSIGRRVATTALAAVAIFVWSAAETQTQERSGKEIVDSLCISCHGTGANGAPKIGDKKAWAARAEKGLTGLTKSAMQGIRQMPAHGGNPALTDTEIERAITYMVNQSGAHWTEPVSRTSKAAARTGKEIVETQCVKCHGTGVNGAPKIGDRAAWTPRVKQGLDVVVRSAIHGHGAMPPRGGMADLTDAEIRSAIVYMFNSGTGATN